MRLLLLVLACTHRATATLAARGVALAPPALRSSTMADKQAARSNWPALESNPEVLTGFIHGVGVPDSFSFHDVFGLDEELLAMVPQPAQALVLLFPEAERSGQTRDAVAAGAEPFFIWQGPALGNACGTIASIHAVVNSAAGAQLSVDGPLASFLAQTKSMHPEDRGAALESNEAIRAVHAAQAQEGQTSSAGASDDVDFHFVCFVHSGGRLYELDGLKGAPVDHGPTDETSLLSNAAKVIKAEFIEKRPDLVNFALLALGPSLSD